MEWTPERLENILEQLLDQGDQSDPKTIKKQQILAAATEQFIRFGYRKTNIAEIAAQAGVAKGTVYLYFKSKPELLVHAIATEKKQYIGRLKSILSPKKSPMDRLTKWIYEVFILGSQMPLTSRVLSGDKDILAALFEYLDTHREQRFQELQLEFITWLIDEAAGPGVLAKQDVQERAQVLLTLAYFSGLLNNDTIRQGLSIERFATVLSSMLTRGIGAVPTPTKEREE